MQITGETLDVLLDALADQLRSLGVQLAARWTVTQDPSPGYRMVLLDALKALGVEDADLGA